jgi:hypothetical protein
VQDSPVRSHPVIGRDDERGALAELLCDAAAGHGRAALLLGPAGIGKTTLAEAVAEQARAAGHRVAWGRCPDAEAPPYWPWVTALRDLGAVPPFAGADAGGGRSALYPAVVDALTAALPDPGVIVLEDLHWADPASVALLAFVVAALPGLPLLLVLTSRDDPADTSPEVGAALGALPPAVRRIALIGLDLEQSATLATQTAGLDLSATQQSDLHRRSGGNPFFVIEIARLHAARGSAGEVPEGVRAVLARRLARVPNRVLPFLETAAVLGDTDVDLLAAITGTAPRDVADAMAEAERSGLVLTREGRLSFAHALVRETLYAHLGPARRALLHRAVAERDSRASAAELAVHWEQAGGADGRRRAAEHALRAATQAMAETGYEQAVRYFQWALDGAAGDPIEVTRRLGEAQVLCGDVTGGRETLHRGALRALDAGRADEAARAVLAMGSGVGGFEVNISDRRQVEVLTRAEAALPPGDSTVRAAVFARLSVLRTFSSTEADRAEQAEAAVAMARRIDDPGAEAAALGALCDALAGPDHVAVRLEAADRMLTLAQQTPDGPLELLARRLRLVARLEGGDLPGWTARSPPTRSWPTASDCRSTGGRFRSGKGCARRCAETWTPRGSTASSRRTSAGRPRA